MTIKEHLNNVCEKASKCGSISKTFVDEMLLYPGIPNECKEVLNMEYRVGMASDGITPYWMKDICDKIEYPPANMIPFFMGLIVIKNVESEPGLFSNSNN